MLSGGGAKGLAHVGVLQALEERGYDADIVVGTSMGAVVGALYAAGYTPEQVRDRIVAIQWAQLFGPTPVVLGPDRDVRHPILALDLDLSRRRVSRGLLGQWRINHALSRLLFDANARSRGDFDRMARRYRAVATDLKTGESVVLAEGDLARAARASMAVPGFFAPVRWGDRLLVDGGIINNLPTDVARAIGATRVIAVDVSWPPPEIESVAPFAVIGRAIDLMQEAGQGDSIAPDVLIKPEVVGSGAGAQFPNDPTPLFELGYDAAIETLSDSPPDRPRSERPQPAAPERFSALVVEAPDSALAALARTVLRGIAPGPYDENAVLDAVDRLYDSGLFEGVWPRVEEVEGDSPRLVLLLEAPPGISVAAAAGYDNDRGGRAWGSLDFYHTFFARPAVWGASGSFGGIDRWAEASMRVHPRSRPSLAWSVGGYVRDADVRIFGDDVVRTHQVTRPGAWLSFEMPLLLRERVASASLRGEWIDSELGPDGWSYGPVVRFESVDADVRIVGVPLLAAVERRWGDVQYTHAALAASYGAALGPLMVAPLIDAAAVLSDDAPADVYPTLGDRDAMPGLRWGEIRGAARVAAGVDFAVPLLGGYARLRTRVGTVAPRLDDLDDSTIHVGGRVGGLWLTPLGAVDVGVAANTRGDIRFEVLLGRNF
ncbi:MAG TPA: patatin-like phospholipase family protein [Longimicrobiales bacterium]